MLRITEIKLPLDHTPEALEAAVITRLGIENKELRRFTVFKRSYDARKKNKILLIYIVDAETRGEQGILQCFHDDPYIKPAPDMRYQLVAHVENPIPERPIVIGMGPCGLFAGLILAQMGLRPIFWSEEKLCANVRKTHGACGVTACLTQNLTCNLAKAAQALFPMENSTARSKTPNITAEKC